MTTACSDARIAADAAAEAALAAVDIATDVAVNFDTGYAITDTYDVTRSAHRGISAAFRAAGGSAHAPSRDALHAAIRAVNCSTYSAARAAIWAATRGAAYAAVVHSVEGVTDATYAAILVAARAAETTVNQLQEEQP